LHFRRTVIPGLGRSILYSSAAILLATPAPAFAAQHAIRLKSRTFVPPARVAPARSSTARSHGRAHFIVQFDAAVTATQRDALAAAGVRVLARVPEDAVAIVAPASFDASTVSGVRWVGQLDPIDKMSRETYADVQENRTSHPYTVVEFFGDVSGAEAVSSLRAAGLRSVSVQGLPGNYVVVPTTPTALTALAGDDSVAWMFPASDRMIAGEPSPLVDAVEDGTAVADFSAEGDGWDGPGLNPVRLGSFFSTASTDLPASQQASELSRAMTEWSRYADVQWVQASSATAPATVNMLWGPTDHGDGYPFAANVLAHTFYPAPPAAEPLAGDVHFNDEDLWGVAAAGRYDVFSVALHELGHALGLTHSSDPSSVMYPSYQGVLRGLSQSDIDSIRHLYAQRVGSDLPSGWIGGDIGAVGAAGTVTDADANGAITIDASGADVWGTADEFTFASRPLTGDGDVIARVDSIEAVQRWTKAGVMIRDGRDPSAPHAFMLVSGSKGLAFQRRVVAGGITYSTDGVAGAAPYWVKLSRRGDRFDAYAAPDGGAWTLVGSDTIVMHDTVQVGVALTAHLDGAIARATFSAVAINQVAKWTSQDIGAVPIAGSFVNGSATMDLTGSGADIWGTADAFRFAWVPMTGDGEVVARVRSVDYASSWSKAGVMIRQSLTPGAAHAFMLVSAGKGYAFQRREIADGTSVNTAGGTGTAPAWVRLVRRGDTFTAYVSSDGNSWTLVGTDTIPMGQQVYAGLAVTSHTVTASARAVFENVAVR
jgi:regulation of enolase protein 1 (concanavalin A-like superfamily)